MALVLLFLPEVWARRLRQIGTAEPTRRKSSEKQLPRPTPAAAATSGGSPLGTGYEYLPGGWGTRPLNLNQTIGWSHPDYGVEGVSSSG